MPTGAQARQYREATYDLAGNIAAIADLGGGARGRNYVYDALHRLTRGQLLLPGGGAVGGQMDYAYDAVGNRTQFDVADPRLTGVETLTLDSFSNQLVSSAWDFGWTRALSHTDSGNRASDVSNLVGNLSMEYDSSDRLVEVRSGNKAAGEYLHNALGQRVAKTANRETTHYLYDLGGNIVAEADLPRRGAASITAEYVWLGGVPLAYIVTANVYYVHTDHLGTPQVLTDGAAAVAWNADYAPFGYAEITGSITFNLRFPGQYYDAETQAHYNGFRTYDPSLGRYLESDPIGLRGGLNTYAYVGGNPVMRVDPRGLAPKVPCEGDWIFVKARILGWIGPRMSEREAPPGTSLFSWAYDCTCIWTCYECYNTTRQKEVGTIEINSEAYQDFIGGDIKCDCREAPGESLNKPCPQQLSCLARREEQA